MKEKTQNFHSVRKVINGAVEMTSCLTDGEQRLILFSSFNTFFKKL